MEREIKFRAWDENKKVMHNDFQFIKSGNESNDWILFTSDKQPIFDYGKWSKNPHFQQQLKIMQFTGLKDKKGKEVYEGDVVFWTNIDEYGVVYYNEKEVHFFVKPKEEGKTESYLDDSHMEVVGHIYGNNPL